jgi:GT2 family glycosyltransferase
MKIAEENPKVSIVIPNWNGRKLLEQFLPSVVGQNYPSFEVVILDNASADESVKFLEEQYPQVRVIRHDRNDGTAEGSNVGARAARGEYLFFISNDMWLEPNVLTLMTAHLDNDPKVGICTLKMRRITADGQRLMRLDSVGGIIDVFGFGYPRGINEEDHGQWDTPAEVGFSFGGALMTRRALYEKLGGYDPAYFTLTDDLDLSWRVRLLGYKVMAEPRAVLYHRVSATLNTPAFKRAYRRFLSERNTIRMLLKNYRLMNLLWVMPGHLLLLLAEGLFFMLAGQWALAGAGPRSVAWNIRLWKDTREKRREIQNLRTVGDGVILKRRWRHIGKLWMVIDIWKRRKHPDVVNFFGKG